MSNVEMLLQGEVSIMNFEGIDLRDDEYDMSNVMARHVLCNVRCS